VKIREIAEWLGPAFDQCALNLCSNVAEEQGVHIRNEFQRCRDEFSRIACDDIQVVHLRQDLYDLMKRRCPALDIVMLTLFYTRGIRRSRIDTLHENGITDSILRKLKKNLAWSAEIIEVLNDSTVPPLLDAREKQFLTQTHQQRATPSIEALPDALRTALELLENSSICELDPAEEATSEDEFLVYLSLLLAGFGHKLPTLSRMLSAMRIAQYTGSPNDDCLHKTVVVKSGKRKGEINDPFSEGTLDTRLRRFSRDFPVVAGQMKSLVIVVAFRWRSLERLPNGRQVLRVTETVYKCKLRPWAKTEASEAYVPLPQRLATELFTWLELTTSPADQDFIFPNTLGGFMDYENFEARVLEPIRIQLGLGKLNFQILRRTFATLAYGERKGTLKDVQTLLRHTRPDTTLLNYVKEIPDSVFGMVDAMYEGISRTDEKQLLAASPTLGVH
jgi:hypothetical protein